MSTLEYGNVIKIISTNPLYEGKYFFVDRLYDDQLVILSDKETITLGITDQELDDKTIEQIIIVYKPKKGQGFIFQHKLFVGQVIEIEVEGEALPITGKIMQILNENIIQVQTSTKTLYIPLDRGLPKKIISIKTVHKRESKSQVTRAEEVESTGDVGQGDDADEDDLDAVLNIIEEDEDEEKYY